jgi:hypothetical protein
MQLASALLLHLNLNFLKLLYRYLQRITLKLFDCFFCPGELVRGVMRGGRGLIFIDRFIWEIWMV